MPGDYRERLREAEALVLRARTPEEREAFQEIASIWRRLADAPPPPSPEERSGSS